MLSEHVAVDILYNICCVNRLLVGFTEVSFLSLGQCTSKTVINKQPACVIGLRNISAMFFSNFAVHKRKTKKEATVNVPQK
jgi:hypothetical protein